MGTPKMTLKTACIMIRTETGALVLECRDDDLFQLWIQHVQIPS